MFPLQGLFKVLVYVSPRYKRLRSKHKGMTNIQVLRVVFSDVETGETGESQQVRKTSLTGYKVLYVLSYRVI